MLRKIRYTLALLLLELSIYFFLMMAFMLLSTKISLFIILPDCFDDLMVQGTHRVLIYPVYIIAFIGLALLLRPKNKVRAISLMNAGLYMLITLTIMYFQHEPVSSAFTMPAFQIQVILALVSPYLLNRVVNFRSMVALDIFREKIRWEAPVE
jgi:energy-converting hydrogenase Eha subunit C